MRTELPKRSKHTVLAKSLCGALVALALLILPLPALADNETPGTSQTQTQSSTTTTNDNTAPATEPAPLPTISQPANQPAATLQAPQSSSTSGISLQDAPASTTPPPSGASGSQSATSGSSSPQVTVSSQNTVTSNAASGNAVVKDNRDTGNANSGNAEATTTVVNVANANGLTAGNFQTFNCDIRQDIQDNIVIDPTTLLPYCDNNPAIASATGAVGGGQSLQSGASLAEILNKIVLSATSGSATVDNNRDAGSATSGDATALANIVNIANSAISAQHSFVGVINIYSNLKGNILVPQSFVDGLASTGSVTTSGSANTAITNTINAAATSGNATVADNRVGGDATTGDANTSLTIMNLTGQEVIAKNSLLVFVNVMGKWMGMIVPAPGSNTALLGSGIQSSSTGSAQTGNSQATITNDISVSAQSGNAAVTGNRTGGDATSGKASAGVNLLNITNSNFVLDDWFGALFINVLGNWFGNFDIQASAVNGNTPPVSDVQVYQFQQPTAVTPVTAKPTTTASNAANRTAQQATTSPATDITATSTNAGTVLGASTQKPASSDAQGSRGFKLDLLSLAAVVVALTLLVGLATAGIRHRYSA